LCARKTLIINNFAFFFENIFCRGTWSWCISSSASIWHILLLFFFSFIVLFLRPSSTRHFLSRRILNGRYWWENTLDEKLIYTSWCFYFGVFFMCIFSWWCFSSSVWNEINLTFYNSFPLLNLIFIVFLLMCLNKYFACNHVFW
jgi:hypothetical protein